MTKTEKCAQTQKNRIVIHLGDSEMRIYSNELNHWVALGWELGMSDRHKKSLSKSHEQQVPWNKGQTAEQNTSIKNAAVKRKNQKGKQPWNKGLKKETDDRVRDNINKATETKKNKFGNGYGRNNSMTEEHKKHISESGKGKKHNYTKETLKIKLTKDYLTKKKNNSFNSSKPEELLYEKLQKENVNKTIYRQYKDPERYPFYCDFYIVEDDLFIELNAHWSHGGHPFDKDNPEDIKKLNEWIEKAKTSKFYENAILTWTVRDVEKQKCAKENNLNYLTIY